MRESEPIGSGKGELGEAVFVPQAERSTMARVLILFAHPLLERSRVHRGLIRDLPDGPEVTFHDLYEAYPRLDIDVAREQELLLEHDVIVFQFPFYWYSTPPILKQWQDLVLEHGWAYGSEGNALEGKTFMAVLSAGGTEAAYCSQGKNRFTVRELLAPIEQTAMLCGMHFLPPYVVFGTHRLSEGEIIRHSARYRTLLDALSAGELDPAERMRLRGEITINGYVSTLIGAGA